MYYNTDYCKKSRIWQIRKDLKRKGIYIRKKVILVILGIYLINK